ncbi:hypothetical protein KIW84_033045 [Lathyrus oleraceus]|uniref:Uncharacterized protein n=1 Tax=Pisum sativum TaxID=3888 RepID=A0A9D4XXE7_PEA|nr:hypothetical protein KIW84_033045 [Pisum sativum]
MALATVLGHSTNKVCSSGGFIHDDQPEEEVDAILEEYAEDLNNFIIPGGVCHNWVAVDVPMNHYAGISKPIEHNDPTPSPNLEVLVSEVEEDDVKGIPDEITRLLEHERKLIQLYHENQQNSQTGALQMQSKKKKG